MLSPRGCWGIPFTQCFSVRYAHSILYSLLRRPLYFIRYTDEENNENANEQIREIWSMINWSFRKALLVRMAIISLHVNVKTPFHIFSHYCRAIDQPCWGRQRKIAPLLPHAGYGPVCNYLNKQNYSDFFVLMTFFIIFWLNLIVFIVVLIYLEF